MFGREETSNAHLEDRIDSWPNLFEPLANRLRAGSKAGIWVDTDSGALLLERDPETGPEAFKVVLFPSASTQALDALESEIPDPLRRLLRCFNGGSFWGIEILGVIESLTRAARQPLNLTMASIWAANYAGTDQHDLLLATENVGRRGQHGYFLSEDGAVVGQGNGGDEAIGIVGEWPSVAHWLTDRLGQTL